MKGHMSRGGSDGGGSCHSLVCTDCEVLTCVVGLSRKDVLYKWDVSVRERYERDIERGAKLL